MGGPEKVMVVSKVSDLSLSIWRALEIRVVVDDLPREITEDCASVGSLIRMMVVEKTEIWCKDCRTVEI